MLAVVRIPNSDNHVRYVIETLPLAAIAIVYGAATLGRLLGLARGRSRPRSSAAALVTLVEATRGARLPDYRYRGDAWAQQQGRPRRRRPAYLRTNFARNDLFLGYDEAFAHGRARPGRATTRSPRRAARRAPSPR